MHADAAFASARPFLLIVGLRRLAGESARGGEATPCTSFVVSPQHCSGSAAACRNYPPRRNLCSGKTLADTEASGPRRLAPRVQFV